MATVRPGCRVSFAVRLAPLLASLMLAACGDGPDSPSRNPVTSLPATTEPDNGGGAATGPGDNAAPGAPVARAGANAEVREGDWIALDGSASTGAELRYAWRQIGGRTVALQGASSAAAGFTAPSADFDENLRFQLTVTDESGARSVDRVDVAVRALKSIYLVADATTRAALENQLDVLRGDVERSSNATTRLVTSPSSPQAVRELLRAGYETDGLRGAILIGDVPVAYLQSLQDASIVHLSDGFYRELYCPLQATPNPAVFQLSPTNSIGFSCLPAIWVSRIKATRADNALAQISSYLQRNHALRDAYDNWESSMTFVSAMAIDDPANYTSIVNAAFAEHPLYAPAQVNVSQDELASVQKQSFLNGLNSNTEILKANFHGAPYYVFFQGTATGDYLDSSHLQGVRAQPRYIELESCSTGAFDTDRYFAGELLFGGNSLLVQANPMVSAYFSGAFEEQVNSAYRGYALGWSPAQLYVFAYAGSPRHFLGDPTIALRPRASAERGPRLRVGGIEYDEPFSMQFVAPDSVGGAVSTAVLELTNSGDARLELSARSDVAGATTVLPHNTVTSTTGFVFTIQTNDDPIDFALRVALDPGESKQLTVRFDPAADNTPRPANAEYVGLFRFTTNAPDTPAFNVAVRGTRR
jgi:hypothetical protein